MKLQRRHVFVLPFDVIVRDLGLCGGVGGKALDRV